MLTLAVLAVVYLVKETDTCMFTLNILNIPHVINVKIGVSSEHKNWC